MKRLYEPFYIYDNVCMFTKHCSFPSHYSVKKKQQLFENSGNHIKKQRKYGKRICLMAGQCQRREQHQKKVRMEDSEAEEWGDCSENDYLPISPENNEEMEGRDNEGSGDGDQRDGSDETTTGRVKKVSIMWQESGPPAKTPEECPRLEQSMCKISNCQV